VQVVTDYMKKSFLCKAVSLVLSFKCGPVTGEGIAVGDNKKGARKFPYPFFVEHVQPCCQLIRPKSATPLKSREMEVSRARRLLRTASSSAMTMTLSKKVSTGPRRVAISVRAVT